MAGTAGRKQSAPVTGPASSLGSALLGEAVTCWAFPTEGGAVARAPGSHVHWPVVAVYEKFGYSLPLSEAGQQGAVGALNLGPFPPGSVAFWGEDGSVMPSHVGIGAGDGTVVDANAVGGMVQQTPYDIVPGYMGWGYPT
jgi:hypothetical protein